MKLVEEFSKILSEGKSLGFYLSTKNIQGDLGQIRKGEIYTAYTSEEGKKYIFVKLSDPNVDYYEDIEVGVFNSSFRKITDKDTKEMQLLSKWNLVDFGDKWWILNISSEKSVKINIKTIEQIIQDCLKNKGKYITTIQAPSPKKAIEKFKGSYYEVGTMKDAGKDTYVTRKYADQFWMVSKSDISKMSVDKIVNCIKDSELI